MRRGIERTGRQRLQPTPALRAVAAEAVVDARPPVTRLASASGFSRRAFSRARPAPGYGAHARYRHLRKWLQLEALPAPATRVLLFVGRRRITPRETPRHAPPAHPHPLKGLWRGHST